MQYILSFFFFTSISNYNIYFLNIFLFHSPHHMPHSFFIKNKKYRSSNYVISNFVHFLHIYTVYTFFRMCSNYSFSFDCAGTQESTHCPAFSPLFLFYTGARQCLTDVIPKVGIRIDHFTSFALCSSLRTLSVLAALGYVICFQG